MAKLRVQAQHLQAGDIVGSGEVVGRVILNSIHWPNNKVMIYLDSRSALWGKRSFISVERAEKVEE